jgi:hypothetical protein
MKKFFPLFLIPISLLSGNIDVRQSLVNIEQQIGNVLEEFPGIYYHFIALGIDPCIDEMKFCLKDIKNSPKNVESTLIEIINLARKMEGASEECFILPSEARDAFIKIGQEGRALETFYLLQHSWYDRTVKEII